MIQTLVSMFVDHIVSSSSISELPQLKGKTGGVNRVGSTSDLGLRLALRRLGIIRKWIRKSLPRAGTRSD